EDRDHEADVDRGAGRGERSDGEEERVAGEERRDHEPRLAEDDQEQDRVEPRSEVGSPGVQVAVEVEEDVDELAHGTSFLRSDDGSADLEVQQLELDGSPVPRPVLLQAE